MWDFIIDLVVNNLDVILSFGIGLVVKSPIYQTAKRVTKAVVKAIEDDKISDEEVQQIISAYNGKK